LIQVKENMSYAKSFPQLFPVVKLAEFHCMHDHRWLSSISVRQGTDHHGNNIQHTLDSLTANLYG